MIVRNPFSSSCGVSPPHFVGRQDLIQAFKHALYSTIEGSPRHLAFLGDWGMGKTSLLHMLNKQIKSQHCIPVYIPAYPLDKIEEVINLLFAYFSKSIPRSLIRSYSKGLSSTGLTILGTGIEMKLQEPKAEPQLVLTEVIKSAWKRVEKKNWNAFVLLIDDIDSWAIDTRDPILFILRNVFTELRREGCKVMLTVAARPALFSEVRELQEPIVRFFEPHLLGPLREEEVKKAVLTPLENIKIKISSGALKLIYDLSEGHPFYVQILAYSAVNSSKEGLINLHTFKEGLIDSLHSLVYSSKFGDIYRKASVNERHILKLLSQEDRILTHGEIIKGASAKFGLSSGTVRTALKRLSDKGLVRTPSRSRYTIYTKLFGEAIKRGVL